MYNTFWSYTLRRFSMSDLIARCPFLAINKYRDTWPSTTNFNQSLDTQEMQTLIYESDLQKHPINPDLVQEMAGHRNPTPPTKINILSFKCLQTALLLTTYHYRRYLNTSMKSLQCLLSLVLS